MTYKELFDKLKTQQRGALIPFLVLGDPDYKTSFQLITAVIKSGADILELGFPFSDPIADGPTIQEADRRALNSGINTEDCFNLLKEVRKFSDIPIGLLLYSNLVLQYGVENFYKYLSEIKVNSVLLADVPPEESHPFTLIARQYNIDTIFIVSPLSKGKRLENILQNCRGFVYIVSRLGVTGAKKDLQQSTIKLIKNVRKKTNLPLCVGFGISQPEHIRGVINAGADGAIVGSALVKIIEDNLHKKEQLLKTIKQFIRKMKTATGRMSPDRIL